MSADLGFVAEVWDVLREHVDINERTDAADDLINLLIDHNHEADDIKDAFRGDKDISKALKGYAAAHEEDEDPDDFDETNEHD
jgi:hypothetical protein